MLYNSLYPLESKKISFYKSPEGVFIGKNLPLGALTFRLPAVGILRGPKGNCDMRPCAWLRPVTPLVGCDLQPDHGSM